MRLLRCFFKRIYEVLILPCGVLVVAMLLLPNGVGHALEQKPVKIDKMDFSVAQSLKEREESVRLLEVSVKKDREEIDAVKKDVDAKLARIIKLQQELKEQLAELNMTNDAQFKNLIKIYSAMSASKAAPLLNKMEDVTVVQILRAMKTDLVATIIPKLDPDKAVSVSKKLGMLKADPSQ